MPSTKDHSFMEEEEESNRERKELFDWEEEVIEQMMERGFRVFFKRES